jgi:hypothetical protein
MNHKNSDFQTSWNLHFSALEPEPSLVFWLEKKMEECFVFTHRGNFQENMKNVSIWYQQKSIP